MKNEFDIDNVNNEMDKLCEKLSSIDIDSLYEMRSLIFFIRTCLSDYYNGEIDKSEFFDATYQKLKKLVEVNEKVIIEEKRISELNKDGEE